MDFSRPYVHDVDETNLSKVFNILRLTNGVFFGTVNYEAPIRPHMGMFQELDIVGEVIEKFVEDAMQGIASKYTVYNPQVSLLGIARTYVKTRHPTDDEIEHDIDHAGLEQILWPVDFYLKRMENDIRDEVEHKFSHFPKEEINFPKGEQKIFPKKLEAPDNYERIRGLISSKLPKSDSRPVIYIDEIETPYRKLIREGILESDIRANPEKQKVFPLDFMEEEVQRKLKYKTHQDLLDCPHIRIHTFGYFGGPPIDHVYVGPERIEEIKFGLALVPYPVKDLDEVVDIVDRLRPEDVMTGIGKGYITFLAKEGITTRQQYQRVTNTMSILGGPPQDMYTTFDPERRDLIDPETYYQALNKHLEKMSASQRMMQLQYAKAQFLETNPQFTDPRDDGSLAFTYDDEYNERLRQKYADYI